MAELHARRIRGALAYWEGHRKRIVDAIGGAVLKHEPKPTDFQANGATGTDPTGWTVTPTEVGTGTSEMQATREAGATFEITLAGNDNDGLSAQAHGEVFEMTSDQDLYFGVRLKSDEATQADLIAGLAITDTDLLGGVSDAAYFECLDGNTGISTVTEKDSTETQNDDQGTLADNAYITLELYFDGDQSAVYFFIDGTQVARHTANIPDNEALRPTLEFLNGDGNGGYTLTVQWMRVIQIGR